MRIKNVLMVLIIILALISSVSAQWSNTWEVNYEKLGEDPTYETQADVWYNSDWTYRKSITLDSSQIPSTQDNFPMCINIVDTNLRDNALNNGSDILFTNQTGTKLNHEIELFNGSSGQLVAWVNVTSLVHDASTVLYMYYGNAGSGPQENVEDTWDSNFVMVHHFNSTNIGSTLDSTSNNNDGNAIQGDPSFTQSGVVGYSVYYDGNDGLEIADSNSLDITSDLTLEAFANPDSTGRFYAITKWSTSGGDDKCYALALGTDTALRGRLAWASGSSSDVDGSTALGATVWNHMAVVYDDSANTFKAYLNGSEDASAGWDHPSVYTNAKPVTISGYHTGGAPGQPITGYLDECRISNTVRSEDWLEITFNSIINASDGGFFTVGAQETEGGDPIVLPTIETPYPANKTTGVVKTTSEITVFINDTQGAGINWTIETVPDIGSQYNWTSEDGNGSKACTVSSLQYSTNYTIWVNATNNLTDNTSANWSKEQYWFVVEDPPADPFELYLTLSFGGKANVTPAGGDTPVNSNPSPNNGATGVALNPSLNITINDPDGDTMNQTFWTNVSGTWDDIGFNNNSANASVENTTTVFPAYNTKYWWSSNVTDGPNWDNDTYYFTTKLNPINLTINATSGVEETNATLYGYMNTNDSLDTTVYFELDVSDQSFASPEKNVSYGEVSSGEFNKDITALSAGTLYYARVKAGNSGGWNTSWNTTYLLTKPQDASGIGISQSGAGLNISWTKGAGTNLSKLYVNTTGYPADRDSPGTTLIASTANDYYVHTPLTPGQTYYYRVWEYASWSSPAVDKYSDGNISAEETYAGTSPTMTNPNPADTATNVLPTITLWNITIKNYAGNFNWSIETSPNIGSNNSDNAVNGSKNCTLSGIQYNTVYTVYANATTFGTTNSTNNTYTFTTQTNESPVLSSPNPSDTDTGVDKDLASINITINDNDGDLFNWSIETKPDVGTNSSDGDSNGTYECDVTLNYGVLYTWYVNVTDGINTVNQSYTFTTEEKELEIYSTLSFGGKVEVQGGSPTINSVSPANNSLEEDMYVLLEANITEPQSQKFNVTWKTNATGSWEVLQYNSTVTDGNFSYRATFANESDTRYWWRLEVNDTDGNWGNATYKFKTAEYTWGNWSDWWAFNYTIEKPTSLATSTWNTTAINLTWSKNGIDKIVILRNLSGSASYPTTPFDGDTGDVIYNGTLEVFNDTGLKPATVYYYSAWGWNTTNSEFSDEYDTELGSTEGALTISNPYPANESIGNSRPPTNISISITGTNINLSIYFYNLTGTTDHYDELYNWTGQSSGRLEVKNLNTINATMKEFVWGNTTYYWTANATDGSSWVNYSYWYNTTELVGGNDGRYDVNYDGIDIDVFDLNAIWSNGDHTGKKYNGLYDVNNNKAGDGNVDVFDLNACWSNKT